MLRFAPAQVQSISDIDDGHQVPCSPTSKGGLVPASGSARNAPKGTSQRHARAAAAAQQRELLLPASYYHVVFTLPAELRRVVRSHQQVLLGVLFRAAFDALQAMCHNPRWLGGRIGALVVLHTWT